MPNLHARSLPPIFGCSPVRITFFTIFNDKIWFCNVLLDKFWISVPPKFWWGKLPPVTILPSVWMVLNDTTPQEILDFLKCLYKITNTDFGEYRKLETLAGSVLGGKWSDCLTFLGNNIAILERSFWCETLSLYWLVSETKVCQHFRSYMIIVLFFFKD